VQGTYNPYAYRIAIDRALISGAHGMARLGTDYWQNIFLDGLKSGGFLRPGMPVSAMFYPGQNGAETSQRFESMREGVQETDARIFVEQAIDRGYIKGDLAKRAKEVLFQHNRQTLFLPVGGGVKHFEYYTGWQGRSKRLFDIAGEVAKTVPFDINPSKLDVYVPARGEKRTTLKLRNWTTSPREWKISCDKPWLVPEKPGGKLLGHEELTVTINAKQLEPGKPVEAAITITDIASDRTFQIALTGNVSKVFEYIPPDTKILYRYWPDRGSVVLNVPAQGQKSAPITLLNRAGAPLKWTSRVVAKNTGKPVPWVKVEPAQGTIAARTPLILTVTAAPPDKDGARHELVLKVSEADGTAGAEASFVVYAMPPYKAPALPQGEAVVIKREIGKALQPWLGDRGTPWGATPAKKYEGCTSKWERMHQAVNLVRGEHFPFMVRAGVPHEVKFKIEGAGYKALSVKVGLPDTYAMHRYRRPHDYPKWLRMNMEIFVDGKLRTQSGMMGTDDKARLLVVDGLENAKELKLRARMNKFPGIGVHTVWGSPTLYK